MGEGENYMICEDASGIDWEYTPYNGHSVPDNNRRVHVRCRSDLNIADSFGYYDNVQNWWVTENGISPNGFYPSYWRNI